MIRLCSFTYIETGPSVVQAGLELWMLRPGLRGCATMPAGWTIVNELCGGELLMRLCLALG